MTITQLDYVLAVAEHKNFTRAAQSVFVTQPTLSMQIQKLEEELGISIFNRNKKPIEPTEVGAKIISQAKNIVVESNRIQDIIDQEKGFIGGEFNIGIIPTIMPTLLPMFLNNFTKKYPKVKLNIEELHTAAIIEGLDDGHLDAAIAATPLERDSLKERPLYYEPFVAYIPDGHRLFDYDRIKVEQLEIDDILLLEDGHCFRQGVINLCQANNERLNSKFQLQTGSFETVIKLANENLGMTLLPYLHTQDIDESHRRNLRMFTKPAPAREVSLIFSQNELKMQIVEALQSVISGVVRGAIAFQDVDIISPLDKEKMNQNIRTRVS